jgi:hypothetical protein
MRDNMEMKRLEMYAAIIGMADKTQAKRREQLTKDPRIRDIKQMR